MKKSAIQKTTPPPNKEPVACLPVDPPVISEPLPCATSVGKQNPDHDKVDDARLQSTGSNLSSQKQDEEALSAIDLNRTEESQKMMLEQAAIKAQAVFRGFLVIFSFWDLLMLISIKFFYICSGRPFSDSKNIPSFYHLSFSASCASSL